MSMSADFAVLSKTLSADWFLPVNLANRSMQRDISSFGAQNEISKTASDHP
jgi:hypothetical protein